MRKSFHILPCIITTVILFISCDHKELCYKYPRTAEVWIDVDWSKFSQYEIPTGMTLMLYPQSAEGAAVTQVTHATENVVMNLPADHYHLLVFNQSISEFGTFSFRGLEKQATAEVVACEQESRWYATRNEDERVVVNPEWLGVANYGDAEVTQEMIDAEEEAMLRASISISRPTIASLIPVNITHTVNLKLHIRGIQNLRSARASLTGMAGGYHLTTMRPTDGKVTHLMESWSMKRDAVDPTEGILETSFTCFGLPDGHQATAGENLLSVSFLLVDNKTIRDCSFQVGDQFEVNEVAEGNTRQGTLEQEDINLELNLELATDVILPDVKPEGSSSSGFQAIVEDWGDEEECELNI